jgi:hypothetical protein
MPVEECILFANVIHNRLVLTQSMHIKRKTCKDKFLGPKANYELVPKFHVAVRSSHTALRMVTSKFRPNVALPISDKNFTIMHVFQRYIKINSDHMPHVYQKDEREPSKQKIYLLAPSTQM